MFMTNLMNDSDSDSEDPQPTFEKEADYCRRVAVYFGVSFVSALVMLYPLFSMNK